MNTLSRLYRAAGSPKLFIRHANRIYYRRLNWRLHNFEGVAIFEEDWDNLLILDACRYDMFERQSTLPGRLESRTSRGSATTEFLTANFAERDLRDTVYVISNPQLYRNRESIQPALHASIDVWDEPGWNEEHGTVLPETVADHAQRAAQEYPNKRLVVHFMQPHYPFITSDTEFDKGHMTGDRTENVWGQLMTGALTVDEDTLWEIYTDNLDRALPHVEELMNELGGRTVVTADHGNMIGERSFPIPIREWGHPRGIYIEQLVRVPWLIHNNGPRRDIVAEQSKMTTKDIEEETVADRLKNLGYAE